MREILFRGKRLDNGEWVEGFLICPLFDKSRAYIGTLFSIDDHDTDVAEVDPKTVGQFTGLTDRNGARIFEGDFVSAHGYQGYIAMDTDYWEIHWNHSFERSLYIWTNTIEVIGNIYDNPEFLEGGENNG